MRKYPTNYKPNLYLGDDKIRFYLGNQGECTLFCLSINPSTAKPTTAISSIMMSTWRISLRRRC